MISMREHARQPITNLEQFFARRAVREGLAYWRATGDRLTGGGLRSMVKRIITKSVRGVAGQPFLRTLGRATLQPFPSLSARLYRLATVDETSTGDHALMVDSLYRATLSRPADQEGLQHWVRELGSDLPLKDLAENIARLPEFRERHGEEEQIIVNYLNALCGDGLGRSPEAEALPLSQKKETAYSLWVAKYDTISDTDRGMIRAHISTLPYRPLISVTIAVDTTSAVGLDKSFESVISQLYPYWELCLALDNPTEPLVKPFLLSARTLDPRIKLVRSGSARGSESTNAALNATSGEFVTFLRPGDILAEHALYEVVIALGGNRQSDVVYTDTDCLDSEGKRTDPWFKPGWDPDLLLGQDYLSAFAVYRRDLVEGVGWLRSGFEGAKLYDLALRVTRATTPDRIIHVPAILIHCREAKETGHSKSAAELPVAEANGRAVRDHLNSQGDWDALVEPVPQIPAAVRVVWPLPPLEPCVSVIIPTRDLTDLLAECIDGVLHRTDYANLELLIVDNGSVEPDTLRLFDRLASEETRVRILRYPGLFNYSALNNAAAREATGDVLLLLNNDTSVIDSGWLRELVSQVLRPDVGMVGAKLLYANQQVQHGGVVLGPHGSVAHVHRLVERNDPGYRYQLALTRTLSAVTAACVAIRAAVFFEIGGFDEVNLPVAFNDVDLCLRLGDYGYRVVWTPFAELFHLESASRGKEDVNLATSERILGEMKHLKKSWGSLLEFADPFHNPNLLFHPNYFEMPTPPRRTKPWHQPVFAQPPT
jgi:O-antigen biosynthesis protein